MAVLSYVPSTLLLFVSPCYVPEKISYQKYMNFVIGLFTVAIFMTPLYRDIMNKSNYNIIRVIVLINQSTVYWCTPKVFSPFINYIVGKSVDRNGRTAINSFAYVSQLLVTSLMINLLTPLYSWSMSSKFALSLMPFNKDIAFLILTIFLIFALYCLNNTKY